MCVECEVGICDICKEKGVLNRKYYRYNIKCECHSPTHFEIVHHCDKCEPKEPDITKISISTSLLKAHTSTLDNLLKLNHLLNGVCLFNINKDALNHLEKVQDLIRTEIKNLKDLNV